MYFLRTPRIARLLFPAALWSLEGKAGEVFLTFDDGPDPEVTPWVLEQLSRANAKATFFLIGKNAERHPQLVKDILSQGHALGNHTYSHLNAWKAKPADFIADTERCSQAIAGITGTSPAFFRPPYGRLTSGLYRKLKDQYQLVMWDLMPGDFDERKTGEQVLNACLNRCRPGSIIVLHDSLKAKSRLEASLALFLKELNERGIPAAAIRRL